MYINILNDYILNNDIIALFNRSHIYYFIVKIDYIISLRFMHLYYTKQSLMYTNR